MVFRLPYNVSLVTSTRRSQFGSSQVRHTTRQPEKTSPGLIVHPDVQVVELAGLNKGNEATVKSFAIWRNGHSRKVLWEIRTHGIECGIRHIRSKLWTSVNAWFLLVFRQDSHSGTSTCLIALAWKGPSQAELWKLPSHGVSNDQLSRDHLGVLGAIVLSGTTRLVCVCAWGGSQSLSIETVEPDLEARMTSREWTHHPKPYPSWRWPCPETRGGVRRASLFPSLWLGICCPSDVPSLFSQTGRRFTLGRTMEITDVAQLRVASPLHKGLQWQTVVADGVRLSGGRCRYHAFLSVSYHSPRS